MIPIKFHFIMPVWGKEYTDQFLRVTLPCQLSEGNLGCFYKRACGDKYKIYTISEDAVAIEKAPIFSTLTKIIDTEIHRLDEALEEAERNGKTKYDLMSLCHAQGIREAISDQATFVSLCADMVFSDGSFANLLNIVSRGKRLVAIGSYRVTTETFVPLLLKKFYSLADHCISVSSHELVKLSLGHIHPDSRILFVNPSSYSNSWPAYMFWEVKGEGVLKRGFHLHPIAINPSCKEETPFLLPGATIDGYDYMMRAVPDYSDVYVVSDSDELTCFSLHPSDSRVTSLPGTFSPLQIASWIKRHCCSYHVNFFQAKIRFHSTDLSPQWEEIEHESDKVVNSVLGYLQLLDRQPDIFNEVVKIINNFWREVEYLKIEEAAAQFKFGEELKNQGKIEEALKAFKRVGQLEPRLPRLHNLLGIALYQLKEFTSAQQAFQTAIKLSPKNVDARVNLAELWHGQGQYARAIGYLKEAAKLAPGDTEILTSLGTLGMKYGDSGAIDLAREYLRKVEPNHPMLQTLPQNSSVPQKVEVY